MVKSEGKVAGKVAFVTGAGRGQGRSHAVGLAEQGADIIAIDVCEQIETAHYPLSSLEDLKETHRLVEATGRRIVSRQADVRDFASLAAALEDGVSEFGRLDIVSANAGISGQGGLHEIEEQAWADMLAVNLTGAWLTAKASIPHIRAGGRGGSIIMTGSAAGLKPYEWCGHYNVSKAGLVSLMKTLALELAQDWIRVNAIMPTAVNTPMIQNDDFYHLYRPDLEKPTADDLHGLMDVNALPLKWIEPIDVTRTLLYLASDDSRYVTGVALPVDAGASTK
ncbi:mycofactocin-coupled SDR family oxidoreductase [Rhodococcus erythropolis]|uniref:mycofactocin-coupled SDR family oxidoreductase n=1 Tax=Rhodococcus erythropolis TaxID=1833 RepID=UPI0029496136|nr:mycofactocin-coupled SDR family oxidoreductase [Rhodococcus erythropolis]MDV6212811.1 mycofactocin-coupled SDR family oxidoreductase [Rhodococcus erythropolis]